MTATAKSVVELFALMGVLASVLALLACLVVRAGRLRPGWQAAVWLVVLVKFVLPWGPALPWSLADLFAAIGHHDPGAMLVVPAAGPAPVAAVSGAWLVLAGAWLAGAAVVLGRALIAQRRVAGAARRASPAPAHARALLATFARRPPRLVIGEPTVGPHVVGIVRPIIVIPPALLDDPVLLGPALLHELAHIRRHDALARVVQLVAGAVFFFWPVVWLVNRRLDLAREAACDAWALDASEVPRPAYARLLVRMAQLRAADAASLAAPRGLDARVAAVLGPPARARLGPAHRLALIGWIGLALGGARTAAARGEHMACKYTPQLAEALRQAHPEADRDGDGVLSRDEACEFQAELRRRVESSAGPVGSDPVSRLDEIDEDLLSEPLCCNCEHGAEDSAPWIDKRSGACPSDEGVSR
ncbi:MAG TPA: M56 family metallopeptidase [Kofleriaceae bacterium]|nr:M56 family metallopeptidase [Kofleriaceae bacterium]